MAGDEADQAEARKLAAGAAGGDLGDAEFGGDLRLSGQLVTRSGALGGFGELVGGPDPGAGVRVILLDGLALSALMVRYNIGVQDQQTYVIKRVDEDFFDEN